MLNILEELRVSVRNAVCDLQCLFGMYVKSEGEFAEELIVEVRVSLLDQNGEVLFVIS